MKTKEQTHYNVFITDKGIPVAPIAVIVPITIDEDGDETQNFLDAKMEHPAFRYCAQFEKIEEANSFYLTILEYVDCTVIFQEKHEEQVKNSFIKCEFERLKSADVLYKYTAGTFAFLSEDENDKKCTAFLPIFRKKDIDKIIDIIFS